MTWPSEVDFGRWDEDIYISEDPDVEVIEPVFGWCRIAVRKVDGVVEKVTEWRFSVEPPGLFIDDSLSGSPGASDQL